jgi:exosortase/archaeosortase family protein
MKPFILKYKRVFLFLLRFGFIFSLLDILFLGYVGLVDPRGGYYSAFLAKYSLIDLVLKAIIYPVKWVLELSGFEARWSRNTIGILGSNGAVIEFPCLGIELMIVLFSFIIAFPNKRQKIRFVCLGILGVHLINIVRICTIILVNHYLTGIKNKTHDYFNMISWAFILGIIYLYIQYAEPSKKINLFHKIIRESIK